MSHAFPQYSNRFFLYAPLAVFAVLCVAASVTWWIKASAWSDRLAAANGREVMPGVTLSFAAKKIGGFPFNLDTEFSDLTIAVATPNGPTRWSSEKFALHALTYGRDETIFEAAGRQRLEWTKQDGTRNTLDFAVGALRASAIVRSGLLSRFDFDLVGFGSKAFTARRLQLHARRNNGDTLDVLATADGLTACSRHVVRDTTTITKLDALAPLLSGAQSYPVAATAWRNAGGTAMADKNDLPAVSELAAEQLLNPSALALAICRR
jgi:hypothetical protein